MKIKFRVVYVDKHWRVYKRTFGIYTHVSTYGFHYNYFTWGNAVEDIHRYCGKMDVEIFLKIT